MGLFDGFPHSNMHQLNLDWILKVCKKAEESINTLDEKARRAEASANSATASASEARESAENARRSAETFRTDTSFTAEGVSADSKAVGERFANLKAKDVGARPDTWLPTIEEIGAAPAGYGFGEDMLVRSMPLLAVWEDTYVQLCAKVDNMLQSMADYTAMLVLARGEINGQNPYENSGNCLAVLYKIDDASAHLVTLAHGNVKPGALWQMHKIGGVWQELEWLNPPMLPGVEYRTTERWNGKAVYTKLVNCGNLPASGERDVSVLPQAYKIIRCSGCTSDNWALPIVASEGDIRITAFGSSVRMVASRDLSYQTVDATLWYVKD